MTRKSNPVTRGILLGGVALVTLTASAARIGALAPVVAPGALSKAQFDALSLHLRKTAWQPLTPEAFTPVTGVTPAGGGHAIDEYGAAESTAASASQGEASASGSSSAPMVLKQVASVETPAGFIMTAPLAGAGDGAYAVVHGGGAVSVLSGAGDLLWTLPATSFMSRTGRLPPGKHPIAPVVLMGLDPVDPFIPAGAHPFAVGDLTGDGVDDVAVAHWFAEQVGIAGRSKSQVSVLDGTSGAFAWSRLYDGYVSNVLIAGRTLVVADQTGDHLGSAWAGIGEDGSRSHLDAWRFSGHAAVPAWSVTTGKSWARWLALEPAGAGALAAAWTDTPVGTSGGPHGHVLRIDAATGAVAWDVTTTGYPRFLRHDAARSQVVALVEDDPQATSQVGYQLLGLAVADGAAATTIAQQNAVATGLEIGSAGWLVPGLAIAPNLSACHDLTGCLGTGAVYLSGSLTAFDPATGQSAWTYNIRGSDPLNGNAQPFGLLADQGPAGKLAIVVSFLSGSQLKALPTPPDTRIDAIDQSTGLAAWSREAINEIFPVFVTSYRRAGTDLVMGAASRLKLYGAGVSTAVNSVASIILQPRTPYQVVRAFDPATGAPVVDTPLLGEVLAVSAARVNGDAVTDLLVGGESGAVFALDGARLNDVKPPILWRRTVSGPIRRMERADLDGDGTPELVVAAGQGIDVLDAVTGARRYALPYPADLVWTMTVADVDGDGLKDIVVPTRTLAAYKGSTGAALWTYTVTAAPSEGPAAFSTAAVTSGRQVAAQYLTQDPAGNMPGNQTVLLLDGATGEELWKHSQESQGATLNLWRGTVATDAAEGVASDAVAFNWSKSQDGTGSDGAPQIDVYAAATGTLAYSGAYPWVHGNAGTIFIPGEGFQAFGDSPSLKVTPAGGQLNLFGWGTNDLQLGNFGEFGTKAVLASFRVAVVILGDNGFDPVGEAAVSPRAYFQTYFVSGGLALLDLDGDGMDEIVSHAFDADGYEAVEQLENRFGWWPDPYLHGFQVLAVQAPPDTTPDPFAFAPRTGVTTGAWITSEARAIAGINAAAPLTIADGQYSIDGAAFTSAAGTIGNGQALRVRHVSASTTGATVESTVTVGAVAAAFRSTTSSLDRVPDAFGFGTQAGVAAGALVESGVVTLTGFNAAIPVVPGSGLEYRIDGGGWTAASGTLAPGATLQVRHQAGTTHLAYRKTALKAGGVTGYFTTRTE
jgi:hypothetical protein